MSIGITTHVLDTARGRPAAGVPIRLDRRTVQNGPQASLREGTWTELGRGVTDADGRLRDLLREPLVAGEYRLTFDTETYFAAAGTEGFFREVQIAFLVREAASHHHVPLLLSPFGYSTYRGS
ncbi:hydroxyisourate hydrolase [Pendulispora rubella]|uniref:5-hydroxyisourate hydrolase n=1 Tax=Pendulispora rubella TaxID=2741070 RepID=A0ABZ2LBH8_9BACT